jgi:putative transposase
LLACTRYVDLNPVRARMVHDPQEYEWSSYRAHIGLAVCDWLDPSPTYLALADTEERRRQRYREFVEQGSNEYELQCIRSALQRNQLTGSEAFVSEIEQRIGERVSIRPRGRPRLVKGK